MNDEFNASCIQLNSGENVSENLKIAEEFIHAACDAGAQFILTPEHTPYFINQKQPEFKQIFSEWQPKILAHFCNLAMQRKVWLNIGIDVLDENNELLSNRVYLINSLGKVVTSYDKIHLFDCNLIGGESYSESKIYKPGKNIVTAKIPWGNLGVSICYDVRFPLLYKQMRKQGADFFSIPSAFTAQTGKSHWYPLLQARAIENSCYVFAPNQCGSHCSSLFKTYGNSVIISPWGEILAKLDDKPGFILAKVSRKEIEKARKQLPASHQD